MNLIGMSSTSETVNTVARLKDAGVDIVNLGPGEPHLATPEHIKAAAIEAIHNSKTKYTPVAGTAELRDAIAERHRLDFRSAYTLEDVIACPGGKYALFNAIQVLVNKGDEVIIPIPYWVSFKDMVRFAGGKCVFVDTTQNDFVLTSEMIQAAVTPRTKLIILNYPNNPSGALMDSASLESLVDIAVRRNIWIISDECYVYLTFCGAPVSVGQFKDSRTNVVLVGSLSKTYSMTGWRVGYAMAPAPIISAMQKLQSQEISCPCSVSQAAAVVALTGPQDCVDAMRQEYVRLRDQTIAGLWSVPGIRTTVPRGAFYVFPDISDQLRSRQLATAREFSSGLLESCGVAIVPGEGFGSTRHARISFSVSEQELVRGLLKLREFCAGQA